MPPDTEPLDPRCHVRPGDVIADKYLVEGILGVGGMGSVLRAWHQDLEQRVAIKLMLRELAAHPEAEARFLREARASVKLRNEHVARVFDVGRLDTGEPYMVMEYLEGKDLADVLAQGGPLGVEESVDYVLQAAEAVAEAHSVGIVHRDLKPANLFLTRDAYDTPTIKVLDFGISKVRQSDVQNTGPGLTGISVVMGTPNYMAPEQMRSAKDAEARSDIFSLGAILYELLTGCLAFPGDGLTEVIAAVLTQPTPQAKALRPEVPEGLDAVIGRCLRKDPADRFASVAEFVHAAAPFGAESSKVSRKRLRREVATLDGLQEKKRPKLEILPSAEDEEPSRPALSAPAHAAPTHVAWGKAQTVDTDAPRGTPRRGPILVVSSAVFAVSLIAGALWMTRSATGAHASPSATPEHGSAPAAAQTDLVLAVPEPVAVTAPTEEALPPSTGAAANPRDPGRGSGSRSASKRDKDPEPPAAASSASADPPTATQAVASTPAPPSTPTAPPPAEQPPPQPQDSPPQQQPPSGPAISDFGGRE